MCDKSIKHIMSQPFSMLHQYRAKQRVCTLSSSSLNLKQESTFFGINIHKTTKCSTQKEIFAIFFTVSDQLNCIFGLVPL